MDESTTRVPSDRMDDISLTDDVDQTSGSVNLESLISSLDTSIQHIKEQSHGNNTNSTSTVSIPSRIVTVLCIVLVLISISILVMICLQMFGLTSPQPLPSHMASCVDQAWISMRSERKQTEKDTPDKNVSQEWINQLTQHVGCCMGYSEACKQILQSVDTTKFDRMALSESESGNSATGLANAATINSMSNGATADSVD